MVTLEQLRRDTDQLAAVDALAGTLVNAVRYSFEQALVPGPSQSPRSGHRLPGGSSSTPQRKVTEYQRVGPEKLNSLWQRLLYLVSVAAAAVQIVRKGSSLMYKLNQRHMFEILFCYQKNLGVKMVPTIY